MTTILGMSGQFSNKAMNLVPGHSGQQLHVSGVFIVLLELALILENLLPVLVVVVWLPASARGVGDRLVAAFSVTCILSALVPTPLGLASYFSGGWYGGAPTCTTYQVTSIWCNLSSLALLTWMCVNCHFAVWNLLKVKLSNRGRCYLSSGVTSSPFSDHGNFSCSSSAVQSRPSNAYSNGKQVSAALTEEDANTLDFSEILSSYSTALETINNTVMPNIIEMELDVETPDSKADCAEYKFTPCQQISDLSLETLLLDKAVTVDHPHRQLNNTSPTTSCVTQQVEYSTCIAGDEMFQQGKLNNHQTEDIYTKTSYINTPEVVSNFKLPQTNYQLAKESIDTENSEEHANTKSSIVTKISIDLSPELNRHSYSVGSVYQPSSASGSDCICCPNCRSRDYVSLMLFVLFTFTLVISSLPVIGYGPQATHSETSCRSWLVPTPSSARERTFFMTFLTFVYACLFLGCTSGISACLKVSKRIKQERKRHSRLYHEEDNVPDIVEMSVLDDLKRQYSLGCVVLAGLFTWLPVVTILTLQKSGVQVSEATIMYSNIATSLPGLLNPLLYSLALARYRAGYKAILEKCCCKRPKRPYCMKEACSVHSESDPGVTKETAMNSSSDCHTCLHGRVNPNFNSHDDIIADEDDDNWAEDCSLDDSEHAEEDRRETTNRISEKTPLQTKPLVVPSVGAFRPQGMKSPWQCQQQARRSSSCSDIKSLLPSVCTDQETGL